MTSALDIVQQKVGSGGLLGQELLDAMRELTIAQQLAFIRRHYGITQGEMATVLGMRQSYYSRLEQSPRHLTNHYVKAAEILGWRLSLLPRASRVVGFSEQKRTTE